MRETPQIQSWWCSRLFAKRPADSRTALNTQAEEEDAKEEEESGTDDEDDDDFIPGFAAGDGEMSQDHATTLERPSRELDNRNAERTAQSLLKLSFGRLLQSAQWSVASETGRKIVTVRFQPRWLERWCRGPRVSVPRMSRKHLERSEGCWSYVGS